MTYSDIMNNDVTKISKNRQDNPEKKCLKIPGGNYEHEFFSLKLSHLIYFTYYIGATF